MSRKGKPPKAAQRHSSVIRRADPCQPSKSFYAPRLGPTCTVLTHLTDCAAAPARSSNRRAVAAAANTVTTSNPHARTQKDTPRSERSNNTSARARAGRIRSTTKNLLQSWPSGSTTPIPNPTMTKMALQPIFLARVRPELKKSRRPATHKTTAPTITVTRGSNSRIRDTCLQPIGRCLLVPTDFGLAWRITSYESRRAEGMSRRPVPFSIDLTVSPAGKGARSAPQRD
jgi:hypothetical protein